MPYPPLLVIAPKLPTCPSNAQHWALSGTMRVFVGSHTYGLEDGASPWELLPFRESLRQLIKHVPRGTLLPSAPVRPPLYPSAASL